MTAATIRLRTPSGALRTFHADRVELSDGLVTATGRWRGGRRRTYTWARRAIVEIRWAHDRTQGAVAQRCATGHADTVTA